MENDQANEEECDGCGERRPTRSVLVGSRVARDLIAEKNGERRHGRKNVAG